MPSIKIDKIGKKFSLQADATSTFQAFRKIFLPRKNFWALKDLSLSFHANDRIALIGLNGSGKTTLLRLIAGIYKPTKGTVSIEGKSAALLQTDVALETELNSVDNIFILASIYGISNKKIADNLDEILDYAQLKKFAHTPVRELSNGMIQRLIMSIMRYIEADIFLIDEVFESGDEKFKQKFYQTFVRTGLKGKILIISTHEKTVLEQFCNKAILLEQGKVVASGNLKAVLKKYDKL